MEYFKFWPCRKSMCKEVDRLLKKSWKGDFPRLAIFVVEVRQPLEDEA